MARDSSFQKKWASDPIQIESPPDDVIASGWVGGAQGRLPEAKWENWWHKRVDDALGEIETDGALQWFAGVPYKIGATVRLDESNWIAAKPSAGISPVSAGNSGHWLRLAPKSTTSVIGPVELATQEEAAAGEDGERAVTPSGLSYALGEFTYNKEKIDNLTRDATTSIKGVSRYASSAETIAGAVGDASVTPAGLAALTATSARRGLVELATPAETAGGEDGARAVTPEGLAALTATESRRGLAARASQQETDAGENDAKFLTPAKLKGWIKQATEDALGFIRIGTQEQTNAGESDVVAVTPKKLRFGFAISLAANGYIKFPAWMGGLIVQWVTGEAMAPNTAAIIDFPIPFPAACVQCVVTGQGTTTDAEPVKPDGMNEVITALFKLDRFRCTVNARRISGISVDHVIPRIIAIGY